MTPDIINILTIFSTIVAVVALLSTIRKHRREKSEESEKLELSVTDSDEYEKILRVTSCLETDRERNRGEHFNDESVYLRRAREMRLSTQFFEWVSGKDK